MEKRALLAFLLSIMILLLWDLYFTPKKEPVKPEKTKQEEMIPEQEAAEQQEEHRASVDAEVLPSFKMEQIEKEVKTWIVDTPVYEARILQPGARLFSLTLKKHKSRAGEDAPFMELITAKPYGYLPLAVELLHHQDFNLSTMSYTGPEETKVKLDGQDNKTMEFRAVADGAVEVVKRYSWKGGSYDIDLTVEVTNLSSEPLRDSLSLSSYYLPYEENEPSYNHSRLAYYANRELTKIDMKKIRKEAVTLENSVNWIGFENNYFIQALIPMTNEPYTLVGRVIRPDVGLLQLVYVSPEFTLSPGEARSWSFRLYMGPKEMEELEKAGHLLTASIDYGWVGFLARPLLKFLVWIYRYTHNYGVAIILLTVIIKLIFWPLTHKSYKSMQKMKEIQPLIAKLREKYKDDREKLNQELLQLYRTYKINPMGGCLPIIIQIPFFFALYRMLYGSVELRHQPFCLWINDLTAPDRLFIGFHIPYLGGVPVLTLLMGLSMFIQQKMSPSPGDPRQERIMLLMPVIFTVFFINFPSGLVLYWFVNNVLSIVQQFWINRATS
ncbi:membrane protein insertase YidC [Thermodesulforhabdus norvegica]|uniref:Membrane protein insertase YidC n=1 Tax=Thermodesulforhabdus norvegica TaxID=39841 RepID=A0A1I4TDP1_9BACT|nr:membrane protein insertase YidC [Thermodesulforhabdus norvegica]SFM74796.1 protein translocase subunit yidC [Thermodesulforhabdus norvegica]